MNKRIHLLVSGRVQGVCFRAETKIRASILGVRGFVKNLENGQVEIVAEGERLKVDKLAQWAKKGPALAKVTSVQILEQEYAGEYKKFSIIY